MGVSGVSGGYGYSAQPSENQIQQLLTQYFSNPTDTNYKAAEDALEKIINNRNYPIKQIESAIQVLAIYKELEIKVRQ